MKTDSVCKSVSSEIATLIRWTLLMWVLILLPPIGLAFFENVTFSYISTLAIHSLPLAFAVGGVFVMVSYGLQGVVSYIRRQNIGTVNFDPSRFARLTVLLAVWLTFAFLLWLVVGKPHYW